MRTDGVHPVVETKLYTTFESGYNNHDRAAEHINGWFKAPKTGNYRFYLASDDQSKLWINTANKFDGSKTDAYAMTEIAVRNHWSYAWRNYNLVTTMPDSSGNKWITNWIALEKDQFYKVEGFWMEGTGDDYFSVAVEFEQADTAGHHHATKEVQTLSASTDIEYERFNITIVGNSGGNFKIVFTNPLYDPQVTGSFRTWTSSLFADNETSASRVRNAI